MEIIKEQNNIKIINNNGDKKIILENTFSKMQLEKIASTLDNICNDLYNVPLSYNVAKIIGLDDTRKNLVQSIHNIAKIIADLYGASWTDIFLPYGKKEGKQ